MKLLKFQTSFDEILDIKWFPALMKIRQSPKYFLDSGTKEVSLRDYYRTSHTSFRGRRTRIRQVTELPYEFYTEIFDFFFHILDYDSEYSIVSQMLLVRGMTWKFRSEGCYTVSVPCFTHERTFPRTCIATFLKVIGKVLNSDDIPSHHATRRQKCFPLYKISELDCRL